MGSLLESSLDFEGRAGLMELEAEPLESSSMLFGELILNIG